MLPELFLRLAVRLRSSFPDGKIELTDHGLLVSFPACPNWEVEVSTKPQSEQFQIVESVIRVRYECLQDIPEGDFARLLAAENLGLRGATLVADETHGKHAIAIRSTFVGQKGRTRDEAENLAIDTLSLLRFARLFEDRVLKSQVNNQFSYDLYYSQYLLRSIGRNRFINYARSIFQGSTGRVFGQMASMMKEDYKYDVNVSRGSVATVTPPGSKTVIILRIPDEIPMLTCSASLHMANCEPEKAFDLVTRLNPLLKSGHLEVNADGSLISFVTWKHLTNDLRYYSLDQMIASVHEAEKLLAEHLPAQEEKTSEQKKGRVASMDAYYRSAA